VARKRFLGALVALVALGAACSGGGGNALRGVDDKRDNSGTTSSTRPSPETGGEVDLDEPELDGPIRPLRHASAKDRVAEDADSVMIAAAIDVGNFWDEAYPDLYGKPLTPLEGGFWSYGPKSPKAELPECGGPVVYAQIAENAFYCPAGDLIAWDRVALVEPFIDEFGAFTAALVLAHEYGHAIQARTGDSKRLAPVITELQADCFTGAWVAHVASGGSDVFKADLDEVDVAVGGLIAIRDAPGASPDDPSAHGSGFDRVSAFSDGLFDGVERCASYVTAPPVVTELPYESEDEAASGGNLSTEELLPELEADLDDFYDTLFRAAGRTWRSIDEVELFDPARDRVTCGRTQLTKDQADFGIFYCIDENKVVADGKGLLPALAKIGDFAIASELARQWAFAAQVQVGELDNTLETSLHADCLTGLYAGDVFFRERPNATLQLSPGDLDEAIISFLAFGASEDVARAGTPFQRSDAFRLGFLGTAKDCDSILPG
jgi:predicted metalloprotease